MNKALFWFLWLPIALPLLAVSLITWPFWMIDLAIEKLMTYIKRKIMKLTKYD